MPPLRDTRVVNGSSTEKPIVRGRFAEMLREWRAARGFSQLALSAEAGVSSRHISFLETSRSDPSREMVIRLSKVLEVPLRYRNAMLTAAGYAPIYEERALGDSELSHVRRAVELMLKALEPNPSIVLDRNWEVLGRNEAMANLATLLLNDQTPVETNLARSLLDRSGLGASLVNWTEVASAVMGRVRLEAQHSRSPETLELLEELVLLCGSVEGPDLRAEFPIERPIIPLQIKHPSVSLNLFTTITTLGAPLDVTIDELRIETLFPADAASEAALQRLVAHDLPSPQPR